MLKTQAYLGIKQSGNYFELALLNTKAKKPVRDKAEDIFSWITKNTKNIKIVGAGINVLNFKPLASRLWLEADISPFIFKGSSEDAAYFAKDQFEEDGSFDSKLGDKNQVISPFLCDLQAYEKVADSRQFDTLIKLAKQFKNKKIIYISATPQGGGVALMRHSLMRLYRELGVSASWHVTLEDPEIFKITKNKFHNILQDVAEASVSLDDEDKKLLDAWSLKNYKMLAPAISKADVIVIDDPQPSGLVPFIRRDFPGKPIVYRSHIHLVAELADKADTAQNTTWKYIWNKIKSADLFIAHPRPQFVPGDIARNKLLYQGAAIDRLDGLNKPLSKDQISYYISVFNKMLVEEQQTPLDVHRDFIVQLARFDPSKGIVDLLEAYRILRENLTSTESPQLVIAGNGSIDDPDGVPIYQMIRGLLETSEYKDIASDIKVLRIKHMDQILDTLFQEAKVALQLSHKEGFEDKVTGALLKSKPVIVSKTGGIPLQVAENKNGFLVEPGDTHKTAYFLEKLIKNQDIYEKMSKNAIKYANSHVNEVAGACFWLYIARELLKGNFKPNGAYIGDLVF